MATVSSISSHVNAPASIERVIEWAEGQAEKGDMGGAAARLRATALRQLAEFVAPDEPKDARSVLASIDRLRDRWATKNLGSKSETARTYASRARTTIEEFFRWEESPGTYDPKRTQVRVDRKATSTNKKEAIEVTAVTVAAPLATQAVESRAPNLRDFPLGDGRGAILFTLPTDGVTFAEVRKFAVHLFTLATDFNIADENQARTFAMVVRGE